MPSNPTDDAIDANNALEIEQKIEAITNCSRILFYPVTLMEYLTATPLIQHWLRLNGMNEASIRDASTTVLANAYRVGQNYINKVNADAGKRPIPKRRGSFGLNFDIDFGSSAKDLLTSDSKPNPTATPSTPTIDQAAIARAASLVIGPKLEAAKLELSRTIDEKVAAATKTLILSDQAKHAISECAKNAAIGAIDSYAKRNDEIIANLERMIPRTIEIKTGNFKKTLPAEARHKAFDEILTTLLCGEHVYLVGPAGTGKTHLFSQIGNALDQPTTILGQTLTKYEFSGHMGPTGEYVTTLLRHAVEEGHLFCIDEIDTSASAAVVFLNSLLANRFIAFPDRMVTAHENFKVIAAANTFGFGANQAYVGRNPLDAASLDRFTYIECDYDEDLERTLFGDTPWTAYVHRVRKAVTKLELKHVISMRAIDRGRKLLANGTDINRVLKAALWRNLPADAIARIENQAGKFSRKLEEAA